MSDDLVKRLRHGIGDAVRDHALMQEAADRIEALEARARDAEAERDALKDREKHFASVLSVADGGQYRNDWDAAIRRVVAERDVLRKALIEAKSELRDYGPDHPAMRQIDAAIASATLKEADT